MLKKSKSIIEKIENSKTPFHYFALSFLFIVLLRSFLESLSDTDAIGTIQTSIIIHYFFFYTNLSVLLIFLFSFVTREKIKKVSKIILSGFVIILSVPLVDLLLSGGKGYDTAYLFPEIHGNLFSRFISFFGEFYTSGMGITPGIRLEIVFVLLFSFIYFLIKEIGWLKSLISVCFVYTLIFIYLSFPFFVEGILDLFGFKYSYSPDLMSKFYLLILLLSGLMASFFVNKKYFNLILRDIRLFRLFFYESLLILGVGLGLKFSSLALTVDDYFSFLFVFISIVLAWLFSVMTNNIEDYEIDKISNKERPLAKNRIDMVLYKKIAWVFFAVSLLFAGFANFTAFFVVFLFIGNYFLYSMPPFRLKRIPFFSKALIALNSLVLIMLGFALTSGLSLESISFPPIIFILVLFILTGIINFIDIKDYEGDKQEGIKTLPVLLGLKKAKILISLFWGMLYLFLCLIAQDRVTLVVFFLLGIFQVYLINRRDYNEKHIFSIIFLSLFYIFFKIIFG